jgi:hypothetical protein
MVNGPITKLTLSDESNVTALRLPAASVKLPADILGCNVPKPALVTEMLNVLESPELVTLQITEVAVPIFVISALLNVTGLMTSEKVTLKTIGKELVFGA